MIVMLIDSHCHLDYFTDDEIPALLDRAKKSGVELVQTICTKVSDFDKVINIAELYDNVYASVGVHPNEAKELVTLEKLLDLTKHPKVISIGETGLDYHYETTSRVIQKQSFQIHIEASRITGLPLVIHSRDADEDMIEILNREYKKGKFRAVMHSFTSSEKLCNVALDLGFYISFSGIVTFKNAKAVQEIACKIPKSRILIETDSPYLTPEPYRGRKNEPSFVIHVAEKISELKNCYAMHSITSANFFNIFNKS